MAIKFTSHTTEQTILFGTNLVRYLSAGDVLALEGGLGAGKTTLTKGIAKGLGISELISSPTFTLIKEYDGKLPFYHIDAYRLHDHDDIDFLEEYLNGDGITVVEWASKIKHILPPKTINIEIELVGKSRIISISGKHQIIGSLTHLDLIVQEELPQ